MVTAAFAHHRGQAPGVLAGRSQGGGVFAQLVETLALGVGELLGPTHDPVSGTADGRMGQRSVCGDRSGAERPQAAMDGVDVTAIAQLLDLPGERGGVAVYERHRIWSADGTWERLLQQVQAAADAAGEVDWDVAVDSNADGRCRRVPRLARAGPVRIPTVLLRTGPTATAPAASICGAGASGTRFRRSPTARRLACARAHEADGHRASRGAVQEAQHRRTGHQQARTPGPLRRGMTSAATSSWARRPQPRWISGCGHDRSTA